MRINFSLILEERCIWHKNEDNRAFCKVVHDRFQIKEILLFLPQKQHVMLFFPPHSLFPNLWNLCWGTTWQNPVVILISMQEAVSLLPGVAVLLRSSRTGTAWPRNEHSATAYGTHRLTAIYPLVPLRFRTSLLTSGGNQDENLIPSFFDIPYFSAVETNV